MLTPLKPIPPGLRTALGVSFFVFFVAAWAAATYGGLIKPLFLADPVKTLEAGWTLFTEVVAAWFEALDWAKQNPAEANKIMGADVKQSADDFAQSAARVTWYDKKANEEYFAKTMQPFMKEAADILLEGGVIKKMPDLGQLYDASFAK